MSSFSQRRGLKPLQKLVQLDSIDRESRNRLWNALYNSVIAHVKYIYVGGSRAQKRQPCP